MPTHRPKAGTIRAIYLIYLYVTPTPHASSTYIYYYDLNLCLYLYLLHVVSSDRPWWSRQRLARNSLWEAALSILISLYVKLHSPRERARERERERGNCLYRCLSKKKTPPLGRGFIGKQQDFWCRILPLMCFLLIELLPILYCCYCWLIITLYSQNANICIYVL